MTHDRGERLRDRPDAVLVVRRRVDSPAPRRRARPRPPTRPRRRARRRAAIDATLRSRLRLRDDRAQLGRELAQARARTPSARGIASIAASMSSSLTSRCVTARSFVGHTVVERQHALLLHPRHRLLARHAERSDVDLHEVRLDLLEVDRHAAPRPAPRRAGARVHGPRRDRVDVVVERVDARGGDDPRLAHRAAHQMLAAPRVPCELGRRRRAARRAGSRGPSTGTASPCRNAGRTRPRRCPSRPTRSSAGRRRGAASDRARARS